MPANFQQPSGNMYSSYLENLLGPEYRVTYMERRDALNRVDPTTSFYHISHTDPQQGTMSTNLRLGFAAPSAFQTTYGGALQVPTSEFAPQIMTQNREAGYVVPGAWQTVYQPLGDPIKPGPGAQYQKRDDWVPQHSLRSPGESLSILIQAGFEQARSAKAMGQVNVDPQTKIMNILAEGSHPSQIYNVPSGALLMMKQDRPATVRQAARSLQMLDEFADPEDWGVTTWEQQRRILQSRIKAVSEGQPLIQSSTGVDMSAQLKALAYGPDRDTANRWVAYGQGAYQGLPYFPSSSFAKHRTVLDVGRQGVDLFNEAGRRLQPTVPRPGQDPTGFRYTTADFSGRIPQTSLVAGTLFSPQYPIPGAGMYFPENMPEQIGAAGYRQTPTFGLTDDVGGLLAGKTDVRLSMTPGQRVASRLKYEYAQVQPASGGEFVPLEQRAGSHTFRLQDQSIRMPQYYDPVTGMGSAYDEARLGVPGGLLKVTEAQRRALETRLGAMITLDETVSRVFLEQRGHLEMAGKFAIAGTKYDIISQQGRPQVTATLGGGTRQLPIQTISWEAKSMPEAFLNTLGAVSEDVQTGLLNQYLASLIGQGGDFASAAGRMRTVLDDLATARGQAPRTRLDLGALAEARGVPAHMLGQEIFQNVILGGQTIGAFGQQSEAALNQFAQSQLNLSNLQRFGIGFVSSQMTDPVSEVWSQSNVMDLRHAWLRSARERGLRGSNEDLDATFYQEMGFGPVNDQGFRTRTFRPAGFYMPTIAGPSAEPTGGGLINSETIAMLNAVAPGFAQSLGVGLQDITSRGALSRNLRSPSRWAAAQAALIGMGGDLEIPSATVITQDIASRMLSDDRMKAALSRQNANLAGLQMFTESLKSYFPDTSDVEGRVIHFAGAPGRHVLSPRALSIRATEDPATMIDEPYTGQDITRIWDMYQSAFRDALRGTATQDPGMVNQALSRMTTRIADEFGITNYTKSEGLKDLMASDVGAAVTRYAYSAQLARHEVFASPETYKHAIRVELAAQGIEPAEAEVEQAYRMISGQGSQLGRTPRTVRELGVPGITSRFPALAGGEESIFGVRFITQEHLERQGRTVPLTEEMSATHFRMGLGLSTAMGGDFDLDPALQLLGIQAYRDKKGQLRMSFAGVEKSGNVEQGLAAMIERTQNMRYQDVMAKLFTPDQQRLYDPLFQTFQERGGGGLSAVAQGLISTQFGVNPDLPGKGAGPMPYENMIQKLRTYSQAKAQMGITYDFSRALEAAQEALGWPTAQSQQARRGRATLYQPYLDLSSGVPFPIVTEYGTSYLGQTKGGELTMGWGGAVNRVDDPVLFNASSGRERAMTLGNAFGFLQQIAGSAVTPRAGVDLPAPHLIEEAFAQPRRPFGRSDIPEEALVGMARQGYAPGFIQQASLADLLTGVYADPDLDVEQRRRGMQQAVVDYYTTNFADRPEAVYEAPLITAMFGKALESARKKDPSYVLPQSFVSTPWGSEMENRAAVQMPLFGAMRGKGVTGDVATRAMRQLQETAERGNLSNWYLGNLQNVLGLGQTRTYAEMPGLFEETMAGPVQLRGGLLAQIAGVGPQWRTKTSVGEFGPDQYQEMGYFKSNLASLARTLKVPGSQSYLFTGALTGDIPDSADIRRGNEYEVALGALMQGRGWYAAPSRQENKTRDVPYQGAFVWTGERGGERIEAGATPDFLKMYRDAGTGEVNVMAIEQKSPRVGKELSDDDLKGYQLQARFTSWIVDQLRADIAAGGQTGRVAEASLRSTIGSYIPGKREAEEAYQAILQRGLGSQVLITQEGQPIAAEIALAGRGNADVVEAFLESNLGNTRVLPGGSTADIDAIVAEAAQRIMEVRPESLVLANEMAQRAGPMWRNRITEGRRRGTGTGEALRARELLDLVQNRLNIIGREAADVTAAGQPMNIPTQNLGTLQDYMLQAGGPAMRRYASALGNVTSPDIFDTLLTSMQGMITTGAAGGPADYAGVPGVPIQDYMGAVAEVASQMGFDMGVTNVTATQFTAGFTAPTPVAPQDRHLRGYETRLQNLQAQLQVADPADQADIQAKIAQVEKARDTRRANLGLPPLAVAAAAGGAPPQQPPPPTVGGTAQAPPPQQPGGVPPVSGAPTPPVPPPQPAGNQPAPGQYLADPTAAAQEFLQLSQQWMPGITNAADMLRQVTGAGPLGVGTALAGQDPQAVIDAFSSLAPQTAAAQRMTKLANFLLKNIENVDPAGVGGSRDALEQMLSQFVGTATPTGRNVTDVLALGRITGQEKIGGGQLDPTRLAGHFEKLEQISADLTKTFDDLRNKTIDSTKATEEVERLTRERTITQAQMGLDAAAAPLVAARIMDEVTPGRYALRQPQYDRATYGAQVQQVMEAQEGLAGIEATQAQAAMPTNRYARFLRRITGGFGLMYLRSIFNIATSGLQAGWQEAAQMEELVGGTAGLISGVPQFVPNQMREMQNRLALSGQAQAGIPGVINYLQTTPGFQDPYTAITAGMGAYTFAAWAGEQGNPWLANNARRIGIGAAGLALAVSAAQKAQDPESVGLRWALQSQTQQLFTPTDIIARGMLTFNAFVGQFVPAWGQEGLQYMEAAEAHTDIRRGLEQGLTLNQMAVNPDGTPMSEAERGKLYTRTLKTLLYMNPDLDQQAMSQAFSFLAQTTGDFSNIREMAGRISSTGYTPDMARQQLAAFGYGLGAQYDGGVLGQFYQLNQPNAVQTLYQQAGQAVIQQLGTQTQAMLGAAIGIEGIAPYAEGIGAGGITQQEQYIRDMEQWAFRRIRGGTGLMPGFFGLPTEELTPAQMYANQLQEFVLQGKREGRVNIEQFLKRFTDKDDAEIGMIGDMYDALPEVYGQEYLERMSLVQALKRGYALLGMPQFGQERDLEQLSKPELEREMQRLQSGEAAQAGLLARGMAPAQAQRVLAPIAAIEDPRVREQRFGQVGAGGLTAGLLRQAFQLDFAREDQFANVFTEMAVGGGFGAWQQQFYAGIAQYDPFALTQAVQYGVAPELGFQIPDWMASRDVFGARGPAALQGTPLNMAPFTTSGAIHPLFNMLQGNLPGFDFTTGVGQAFAQGYTIPGTNIGSAGTIGAQLYMQQQGFAAQRASLGASMAGLNLTRQYTPMFWAIQDQQRAINWQQQEEGFARSFQQLGLQASQFQQNQQLQQAQAQMQRLWTRQDWAFDDETRALQWGWRVEDFQENLRFMTGRDRRLAERGMERETIMRGREEEAIDRQRERQEELWGLEDQRFELQRQQFEENQAFQEEGIELQQRYFEERKALEVELTELQREYQQKQWDIQAAQIGAQAAQIAAAEQYAILQAGIQQTMLQQAAMMEQAQKNGMEFWEILDRNLRLWIELMGGTPHTSQSSLPPGPEVYTHGGVEIQAWGNELWSGTAAWVGETGPEIVSLRGSQLYSQKRGEIRPTLYDPWQSSGRQAPAAQAQGGDTIIVVNVGNEELKRYVVDTVMSEV